MLRRLVLAALIAIVIVTAGCPKAKPAPTSATRIVSLSPSVTEAIFAIGAGPSLVGRSRYCNYPPEVVRLPQVGGYVDPSIEAILALRPDLVTGSRGPAGSAITDRLGARGIATYFPETETFAQIDQMLLGLGERTGHSGEARAAVDAIHAQISAIEAATAGRPKAKVLLVFGAAPLSVAGPSSFADEMIRRAGGVNAVAEGGAYPTIGIEHVLKIDPDVIIDAAMMDENRTTRIAKDVPGWERVRAVRDGRVMRIDDESVLRPGPRIARGLAILAHAIHPSAPIAAPP